MIDKSEEFHTIGAAIAGLLCIPAVFFVVYAPLLTVIVHKCLPRKRTVGRVIEMFKTGVLRNGEAQFVFFTVEFTPDGANAPLVAYAMTTHRHMDDFQFDRGLDWERCATYFDAGHLCTHGEVVVAKDRTQRGLHVMVDYVSTRWGFIARSLGIVNVLPPYADVPFKLGMITTIFGAAIAAVLIVLLGVFGNDGADPSGDALWFAGCSVGGTLLLCLGNWNYWRRERSLAWWEAARASREELETLRAEIRDERYEQRLERHRRRKNKARRARGAGRGGGARQEEALDALDPASLDYGTTVQATLPAPGARVEDGTAAGSEWSFSETDGDSDWSEAEGAPANGARGGVGASRV